MNIGPVAAFWHLVNFFAPAIAVGVTAAGIGKLFWRREWRGVSGWRLAGWACGSAALALVAGLVVFGRDGKMATYGASLLATALSLWWIGFVRGRR